MTVATVTITDVPGNQYTIEGSLDRPEALDEPPTPALIIATYLSVNIHHVCEEAIKWYDALESKDVAPIN
jgi:hypothetical protein